jgi:arylsulfatase A-like enzyme
MSRTSDRNCCCGLWAAFIVLTWSAAGALAADAAPRPAAGRPNVIVILCDDMGFSDLGCYGGEIQTPHLDALAAGGLRFTQFYNTARCCPSRASLLTGLYPHQAGVGHMTNGRPDLDGYVGDLNDRCVTIAQVLKPAGYATYMVGKWHITKHDTPAGPKDNWPRHRGFDRYYGTIVGAGSFYDPGMLTRDDTVISPFQDHEYQPPAGEPYYYTNALSDQASRFITEHHEQHADQPFFFYVAYTAAHWPMQALERDIAKYKGKYDAGYEPVRKARFEREKRLGLIDPKCELSPQAGEWDKVMNKPWEARCMEVYAAMIDCMDQGVGRIVESLRKTGQLDNTLILFMQDNGGNYEPIGRSGTAARAAGPSLPAQGPDFIETKVTPKRTRDGWPVLQGTGVMPGPPDTYIAYGRGWGNVSNTPFREYKHFVHEGGIATPLIAHWPAHITRKGDLEKQPSHLIDVMATCVDLAGAAYPKQHDGHDVVPMEGRSLLPAFEGKPLDREAIYWEHEGNRAVREGKWKLVAKGPAGAWELYDAEADRTEMNDLATAEPGRTHEMVQKWEAWAKRAHVIPWMWKPQYGTADVPPAKFKPVFDLHAGDDLSRDEAPQIVGRSIHIEADITKGAADGVVLAHGGSAEGYALYVKGGRAAFAVRRRGELTVITAKNVLPPAPLHLAADLAKDGALTLSVNKVPVATGKAGGTLTKMPVDGLQVGRDAGGVVGDYKSPFPFGGEIGGVTVRLSGE